MQIHKQNRIRRKKRVRATISGTAECPRLTVFRSNNAIYAQLIDDTAEGGSVTLAAASSLKDKKCNTEAAQKVGKELADKATKAGISTCKFDRNGYIFHGLVKALANSAREAGLKF